MGDSLLEEVGRGPGTLRHAVHALGRRVTPDLKGVFSPRGVRLAAFAIIG